MAAPPTEADPGTRLNRYLARAGVCSRRKADELIRSGVVAVNGLLTTNLATRVDSGDIVTVGGRQIRLARPRYILLNKPRDTITSARDDRNRRTVMDLIPEPLRHEGVFPVGRLDRDTTGVLLLTNDGDLAHRLMHPRFVMDKVYRVTAEQMITGDQIQRLRDGVRLNDGLAKADGIWRDERRDNVVTISLHEGRNRQIHRMFGAIEHSVKRLDRVEYAGIRYGNLKRGAWRKLTADEIASLRSAVGTKPGSAGNEMDST